MADPAQSSARQTPTQLVGKIGRLGDRLSAARRLAHEAQVREALTRSELTLALNAAMIGLADARAAHETMALQRYLASAKPRRRRRRSRRLERLLARLGPIARRTIIRRAAVPPELFDAAWYLQANPDVAASGEDPLTHYLLRGADERRAPHPLFDLDHYLGENGADLAASGLTPLEHYAQVGAALGRSPSPLFDVAYYLGQGVRPAADEDAFSHYLREGWTHDLRPHPLFDPQWYRCQLSPDESAQPPLRHYVTGGWRRGLTPHPLVDTAWYLEQNPDVADAGLEPLAHFLGAGGRERRNPGPWFDAAHYAAVRGEALGARNPLVDYLQGGAWRVAEPRPGFPGASYLAAAPELVAQGMTPLEHWARRGLTPG